MLAFGAKPWMSERVEPSLDLTCDLWDVDYSLTQGGGSGQDKVLWKKDGVIFKNY